MYITQEIFRRMKEKWGGRCMALNAMYCKRESKDCPFYKSIKEYKRVPCKIPNSDKYVTGGAVERR